MVTPPSAHDAAAIAEIAKGLTKAQREAMSERFSNDVRARSNTRAALWTKGLISGGYDRHSYAPLTPLGLAVRAHISQAKGE